MQLTKYDLSDLIKKASICGAKHIELRQNSMGKYEKGSEKEWRPINTKLRNVKDVFSNLSFSLAINLECLSQIIDPFSNFYQSALNTTLILNQNNPILRVVDPYIFNNCWESKEQIPKTIIKSLKNIVEETANHGITLAIENEGQPISSMLLLIQAVRETLSNKYCKYLGICPDLANQIIHYNNSNPLKELEELPSDIIKIVHFKQTVNFTLYPKIDIGDIDCIRQLKILQKKNYLGPLIIEIPPNEKIFENLIFSINFLRSLNH